MQKILAQLNATIITAVLIIAHQACANPSIAQQQATGYYYAHCGGPTPAHCQGGNPAPQEYYNYIVATVWLKIEHPQGSNMPLIYANKLISPYNNQWHTYSKQMSNYALADCEKRYGQGSCERGEYTWGINNAIAVASPAKKGTNTFSAVALGDTKHQAEQSAIASCQADANSWNADHPQLRYNPKDCKVIYSKVLKAVKGKKVKYKVYKNY